MIKMIPQNLTTIVRRADQNSAQKADPSDKQIKNLNTKVVEGDKRDPRILKAAQMYEQEFLKEMVTAMRKAVPKGGLTEESMGEKIYAEKLDDQYVEQWTNMGGVGLSNLIYDQVMEKFGPQKQFQRPQGPIPMDKHKTFQIDPSGNAPAAKAPGDPATPKTTGAMTFKITPQKFAQDNSDIRMPWAGELKSVQTLDTGEKAAIVQHDNGLRSTFLFQGKLPPDKKAFGPGESFAILDSKKDFLWKLDKS